MTIMAIIVATSDPVTSIPLHRSTLNVLKRVKNAAETWDEFLITLTDDFLSPALQAELDRRLQKDSIISGEQAKREFRELSRRAR